MTLICPPVARRSAAPPQRQWWSRAWQRMVEESRSDETEWMRARRLARSGQLGAIRVVEGRALVATHGPEAAAAPLPDDARAAFFPVAPLSNPRTSR